MSTATTPKNPVAQSPTVGANVGAPNAEPIANGGALLATRDRLQTFAKANPALVKALGKRFDGLIVGRIPSKEEAAQLVEDIASFMQDLSDCIASPSANFRTPKRGINVSGPRLANAFLGEDKAILTDR